MAGRVKPGAKLPTGSPSDGDRSSVFRDNPWAGRRRTRKKMTGTIRPVGIGVSFQGIRMAFNSMVGELP